MATVMSEEQDTLQLDRARQQLLEERVILLAPSFGYWIGSYQLPRGKTNVEVDGQEVDADAVTTPRSKLMTNKFPVDRNGTAWKTRFTKIATLQGKIIDQYSVRFPITGVRVIPKSQARAFFYEMFGTLLGDLETQRVQAERDQDYAKSRKLDVTIARCRELDPNAGPMTPVFDPDREEQSVAYQLWAAANEFVSTLDDVLRQIQANTDATVWEAVQAKIPRIPYQMRAKFYTDVVPVELAGSSGSTLMAGDLDAHEAIVRDACRRKVEEALETMIEGPRKQLADALTNLKELINRDANVTAKCFKPVREAIAKLRSFDFVASPQLMEEIRKLETRLNITTPKSLDSVTAANNGFTAAITAVIDEVSSAERQAADLEEFGRDNFRSIDIG